MKEIPLTQGLVTIVDDEDFAMLNQSRWYAFRSSRSVYAIRNMTVEETRMNDGRRGSVRMHSVIVGATKGQCVDHRNFNGLDNRRENLRVATPSQNAMNRRRNTGKDAPKGVDRHNGKWRVRLNKRHVGYFKTKNEASRAYDESASKAFGEFAALNRRGQDMDIAAAPFKTRELVRQVRQHFGAL